MKKQKNVNALQKHKTSDKIKWFVVFTLVLLLIASVVAICVTLVPGVDQDEEVSAISDVAPVSVQNIDAEDAIKISFEYDPEKSPTVEEVFGSQIFESTLIRPYVVDTGMMGEIGGAQFSYNDTSFDNFLYANFIVKNDEKYTHFIGLYWGADLSNYIGFFAESDSLEGLDAVEYEFQGLNVNGESVTTAGTVEINISGLLEVVAFDNYVRG